MEQFKQFSIEKQAAINSLLQLRGMLEMLGEMGINISDDLQKVTSAINAIESDVLRIALLGAFSDGKTSVIAAWLGKVMDDMNISMDESSDWLVFTNRKVCQISVKLLIRPGCLVIKSARWTETGDV